jgi:hypothetical protein
VSTSREEKNKIQSKAILMMIIIIIIIIIMYATLSWSYGVKIHINNISVFQNRVL